MNLAVAAIDAGGESSLRVNHLAAAAGVTPPVLYYHVGSREGLVIAAQVERYSQQAMADVETISQTVSRCTSREELRGVLAETWTRIIAMRRESRRRRMSALANAYARPELQAAISASQDEIVEALTRMLQPCLERGWLRPGIDLTSAVAWQHSVLMGRVHVERGQQLVDPDEWDRLTLEAFDHAFFGSRRSTVRSRQSAPRRPSSP